LSQKLLEKREYEGKSFAGAGLRGRDQIGARERGWNCLSLNRRRYLEAVRSEVLL
jgi:hypothetical protein